MEQRIDTAEDKLVKAVNQPLSKARIARELCRKCVQMSRGLFVMRVRTAVDKRKE